MTKKIDFNFPAEITKFAEEEGEFHIIGYAATTDFDLQGDIITEEALRSSSLDLIKNSTVLLNHDLKKPIGKVTKAEFDKNGLLIDVLISKTEPDIIQKIKEGVLNKFSIRGQVLERERVFSPEHERIVNVIKRMNLIEVSLVSVPANPQAKAIGWYISKAINEVEEKEAEMQETEDIVLEKLEPKDDNVNDATPKKENKEAPAANIKPENNNGNKDAFNEMLNKKPAELHKGCGIDETQLQEFFLLLDKIISKGGEQAVYAHQLKEMLKKLQLPAQYPYPQAYPYPQTQPKQISKEELTKIISEEVEKQLNSTLKNIPTLRKGLVQSEEDERKKIHKQFEKLPPEQKLRTLLSIKNKEDK